MLQFFSADTIVFSKKLKKNFLTLKAWKKHPQKLLIIGPDFFFMYWPGCPNDPETEIQYHQKSLNAGLGIFRLGLWDESIVLKYAFCKI